MVVQAGKFITSKEAARIIGCHAAQITRRVQAGELVAIIDPRDRRRRLLEREAIERILLPLQHHDRTAKKAA